MISEEKELDMVEQAGVVIVVIECQEIHHPIAESNYKTVGHHVLHFLLK